MLPNANSNYKVETMSKNHTTSTAYAGYVISEANRYLICFRIWPKKIRISIQEHKKKN